MWCQVRDTPATIQNRSDYCRQSCNLQIDSILQALSVRCCLFNSTHVSHRHSAGASATFYRRGSTSHQNALVSSQAPGQPKPCCSSCSIMACRFHGPFKVEALQQFVADQLLKLPQVAAVKPQNLDQFLARVPQYKVTVLAFSSSSRASLPLRHAAQQHARHVVVGRVHWTADVRLVFCLSCCNCMHLCPCHEWKACCAAEVTLTWAATDARLYEGDSGGEGAGGGWVDRGVWGGDKFRVGRPRLVVIHV